MEDWALIRRLVADGRPKASACRELGTSRSTVAKAVASVRLPKHDRLPRSWASHGPRCRRFGRAAEVRAQEWVDVVHAVGSSC